MESSTGRGPGGEEEFTAEFRLFEAVRTAGPLLGITSPVVINYDQLGTCLGNICEDNPMSLSTGHFTAPLAGTYRFTFLATVGGHCSAPSTSTSAYVLAKVNGAIIDGAFTYSANCEDIQRLSMEFTTFLNDMDVVTMTLESGSILVTPTSGYTRFSGEFWA